MYGIQVAAEDDNDEGAQDADIEASIESELASMSKSSAKPQNGGKGSVFAPMRVAMDCLIFVKTRPPVEPAEFVHRICEDAKATSDHTQRKSRFLNRLTPIELIGKATESGLEEVAKTVLSKHFQLNEDKDKNYDGEDVSVSSIHKQT
jgi:tRNA acetyltransferase TAN1